MMNFIQVSICFLLFLGLELGLGLGLGLAKDGRVYLGLATDWYSVFLILDPIWRFVVDSILKFFGCCCYRCCFC